VVVPLVRVKSLVAIGFPNLRVAVPEVVGAVAFTPTSSTTLSPGRLINSGHVTKTKREEGAVSKSISVIFVSTPDGVSRIASTPSEVNRITIAKVQFTVARFSPTLIANQHHPLPSGDI
jgi:hypothetical protein